MFTDPFNKSGQKQIESVDNTHHAVDTWTDRQRCLQQLVKCVDDVTNAIVNALLRRLLLRQLYAAGICKQDRQTLLKDGLK